MSTESLVIQKLKLTFFQSMNKKVLLGEANL
jgi:hypothetical protein